MNPTNAQDSRPTARHEPLLVVRRIIETLNAIDDETVDHFNALAFILMRVARADGRVCRDERLRMEAILVEHAELSAEHAALVTEIACHRASLADCGASYSTSRGLRARLDADQRRSVVGLLRAVASADGTLSTLEDREIVQIAREIGVEGEL